MEANARRIRYYREYNGENFSYEIKLKRQNIHYSIEFSQEGELQDIEVLINKSELPSVVLEAVKNHFQRIKLTRIQKHFLPQKMQIRSIRFRQYLKTSYCHPPMNLLYRAKPKMDTDNLSS